MMEWCQVYITYEDIYIIYKQVTENNVVLLVLLLLQFLIGIYCLWLEFVVVLECVGINDSSYFPVVQCFYLPPVVTVSSTCWNANYVASGPIRVTFAGSQFPCHDI